MECNVINLDYAILFCVEQNVNKCIELTFRNINDVARTSTKLKRSNKLSEALILKRIKI